MKGLNEFGIKLFKICGLVFVFLVMFSGEQPRMYVSIKNNTKVHLYDDSMFVIEDNDTLAAAKMVMIGDTLAKLYTESLSYRFLEGMSVESDTSYTDSCNVEFEFPNLDCDVLFSFYFCPESMCDYSGLPSIPNEMLEWHLSGPYYLRKTYIPGGTKRCTFRVPRGPVYFEFAIEAIGFPSTTMRGDHYGLTQNPSIFAVEQYRLEDPDVFNTNSQNKRFILPKVDNKLFSMWFLNGDIARITYFEIELKGWKWLWADDDEEDE